ncbi:hypothetical protein BSG1_10308 [Bacillus sp. SG-1]|nr:hypothetical protein BSG1_10308 [Bacillus sp. SG-1]
MLSIWLYIKRLKNYFNIIFPTAAGCLSREERKKLAEKILQA